MADQAREISRFAEPLPQLLVERGVDPKVEALQGSAYWATNKML